MGIAMYITMAALGQPSQACLHASSKTKLSLSPIHARSLLADVLFVSASTPTTTFKAGLDKQGLRLLSVGMTGSTTIGSVLTSLGVPAAANVDDLVVVSGTSVVYVPSVPNTAGKCARRGTFWGNCPKKQSVCHSLSMCGPSVSTAVT